MSGINKLSCDLRSVIGDLDTDESLESVTQTYGIKLAMEASVGPVIDLNLLVDNEEAVALVREECDVVGTLGARHLAVRAPVHSLERISAISGIRAIDVPQMLTSCMDTAAAQANLATFNQRNGRTGAGTLIGVVDTGIDVDHPTFGQRILRVWDHIMPGVGWAGFRNGNILSGPAMKASVDLNGHGTHVAGIAAGSDANYGGVAPGADLVIIKTDFTDRSIVAGLDYLADYAASAGRPMVANLSLGGHYDPHDGSGLLAETIDALSGPGFVVCCAAGNEGDVAIHSEIGLAPAAQEPIEFAVFGVDKTGITVKGWADFDAKISICVVAPDGTHTEWFPFEENAAAQKIRLQGTTVVVVPPAPDSSYSGRIGFLVKLLPVNGVMALGKWEIGVSNDGSTFEPIHAWLVFNEQGAAEFTARSSRDSYKVGSPGSSRHAVTVGAAACRNAWIDFTSTARRLENFSINAPCPFSSPGPLWGGLQKPELIAPGAFINSALSSAAPKPLPPGYQLANSGAFRLMSGTSMACPFVAGIAALLLEGKPGMTHLELKKRLIQACRLPGMSQSGTVYQPKWGYGLLDAALL